MIPEEKAQQPAPDDASLYEVAFAESVRALEDQVDELNNIRQRLVQFLAFIGTATAFLVGSSLRPGDSIPIHRDGTFYTLSVIGSITAAAMLGTVIRVLLPHMTPLATASSARIIIDKFINRQIKPIKHNGDLYRDLAEKYDQGFEDNEYYMTRLRMYYIVAIALGLIQLATWVALVWVTA